MNQEQNSSNSTSYYRQRKKTGPSPKYGPDQAKKMVSMRLSPDALSSIKLAAERVFGDSQADVIEKVVRFLPADLLQELDILSREMKEDHTAVLREALDLYKQKHNIPSNIAKLSN